MTEDHKIITLVGGRHAALVDTEDYERLVVHSWYEFPYPDGKIRAGAFVWVDGKKKTIYMHREVMGLTWGDSREVDHRDSVATLDNRKGNLRIADRSGQTMNRGRNKNNSSGFKNVCLDKRRGLYRAYIVVDYKQKHLGYGSTPEEAFGLYLAVVSKHHGEFANTGQ